MEKVALNPADGAYSKGERSLFSLLPADGTSITSHELVRRRQKREENWRIDYPGNTVSTLMRSLIRKVARNKEPFKLRKSKQRGPYPTEYWIEFK
jgi:hypothetical protein